jgi:hypothetical protein
MSTVDTQRKAFPLQLHLTGSELLHALELIAPDAFKDGFDLNHTQLMDAIVIAKTEASSNKLSTSTRRVCKSGSPRQTSASWNWRSSSMPTARSRKSCLKA